MKRVFSAIVLGAALCATAGAKPIALWQNFGVTNSAPQIDAVAFDNRGSMILTSSIPRIEPFYVFPNSTLFKTLDTRYYTNRGVMFGMIGFDFATIKSSGINSLVTNALVFTNSGQVSGVDTHIVSDFILMEQGYYFSSLPSYSSRVRVAADQIGNTGLISVGDRGVLSLSGKNVNLSRGGLAAGEMNSTRDTYTTNYESYYYKRGYSNEDGFVNCVGVQDIHAYVSASSDISLSYIQGQSPEVWMPYSPFSTAGQYKAFMYRDTVNSTNIYETLVFVRTNEMDDSFIVDARFFPASSSTNSSEATTRFNPIVMMGFVGKDVVTDTQVTNSVYLIDTGASSTNYAIVTNLSSQPMSANSQKPSNFEVSIGTPVEWISTEVYQSNFLVSPSQLWLSSSQNGSANGAFSLYIAQLGLDPQPVPLSSWTLGNASGTYFFHTNTYSVCPTNEPSRIEIAADYLNLSKARIRSEGLLSINAKGIVPITPSNAPAIDAGVYNLNLSGANGQLTLTNIIPSTFGRTRGNVYMWTMNWFATNGGDNYYFHVLMVDHTIQPKAVPTVLDIALHSTTINIEDPIVAKKSALFDGKNIRFNNTMSFSKGVSTLNASVMPSVEQLWVDSNCVMSAENMIDLGFDTNFSKLGVLTNWGAVSASVVRLKTGKFANAGSLFSSNRLTLVVTNDSGRIDLTNNPNNSIETVAGTDQEVEVVTPSSLISGWDTEVDANSFVASNSVIRCGSQTQYAAQGSLILNVSGLLSDGVSSYLSPTNTVVPRVNVNTWEVHNGFQLSQKPALGDLFGTTIHTMCTNFFQVDHIWPGENRGATLSGFINNLVIGHLILDRQSLNSTLHFSGASDTSVNGMYVDYLELANYAYSDYRNGIVVDPNVVIYFGRANVPAEKLALAYPGKFVWVPEWVGPNSATNVTYADGNGVMTNLFVNTMALTDTSIDSNGDGVRNAYDNMALQGTFMRVSVMGNGAVTPSLNNWSLIVGNNYTISATSSGFKYWVYGWDYATSNLDGTFSYHTVVETNSASTLSFTMRSNMYAVAWFSGVSVPLDLSVVPAKAGSVTPLVSGDVVLGNSYKLTATPAAGYAFAGWSGSYSNKAASLSFVADQATTLRANFIRKGVYNAVFYNESNGQTNAGLTNSGYLTLTVTDKGRVSGKVRLAGASYSFTTTISAENTVSAIVKRGKLPSLALNLVLNNDSISSASGTVSDGSTWTSDVDGALSWYNGKTEVAPAAGKYTFALSSFTNTFGDGYGTLSVTAAGAATVSMNNADGSVMTFSGALSRDCSLRIFATKTAAQSVLGKIMFESNDGAVASLTNAYTGLNGQLYWNKTNAFSASLNVIGSAYAPSSTKKSCLSYTNAVADADGVLNTAVFSPKSMSYVASDGSFSLKLNSTGVVTGTSNLKKVRGVVLQRQDQARGYVETGKSTSGSVLLRSAQ
jgi:hypothetical protein